jgi:hypothetical protein
VSVTAFRRGKRFFVLFFVVDSLSS